MQGFIKASHIGLFVHCAIMILALPVIPRRFLPNTIPKPTRPSSPFPSDKTTETRRNWTETKTKRRFFPGP
ncbi:hypothetical protein VTN49DRAFT_3663 [Thermomyces lanuginosus]|uniref:uncharacterized protein n=1 Tax=Thermomyces lanuginosus TaxID=5541 RepID=UPI003743B810